MHAFWAFSGLGDPRLVLGSPGFPKTDHLSSAYIYTAVKPRNVEIVKSIEIW